VESIFEELLGGGDKSRLICDQIESDYMDSFTRFGVLILMATLLSPKDQATVQEMIHRRLLTDAGDPPDPETIAVFEKTKSKLSAAITQIWKMSTLAQDHAGE
jgi:hypothetical protein